MAIVKEIELPGLSQKVRAAQTKNGYLICVDSLCKALFLDPARLNCDSWIVVDEVPSLLFPFMDSHPAVRSFLHDLGAEGMKAMFPNGLTSVELCALLGISEAELMADLPKILEKFGR